MSGIFSKAVQALKGIGQEKAQTLEEELGIETVEDLVTFFPFRYEDRTDFTPIAQLHEEMNSARFRGYLEDYKDHGRRLTARVSDSSGTIELVWFRNYHWIMEAFPLGREYLFTGKPKLFNNRLNITHPEIERPNAQNQKGYLLPVYHSTEAMKKKRLDSRGLVRLMGKILPDVLPEIQENLPEWLRGSYQLIDRSAAIDGVHRPESPDELRKAQYRLKFEELFFVQLRLLQLRKDRQAANPGFVLEQIPSVTHFYQKHLPFDLTGAQKRVIREIRQDLKRGQQMNRLLQGDVGSGKTIVAFISMLMALDSQLQTAMMAPTEILAEQHYNGLAEWAEAMGKRIGLLTGSTPAKHRRRLLEDLANGQLHILVGTHALLEDAVQFHTLGLCVIDEQHRFGVAQRAKLWGKNAGNKPPHILVMTATPIPRTLGMTLYGDLDVSVIDELPAGRKPIETHVYGEGKRLRMLGFVEQEISKGRQAYIVYPLIEESASLDYKHLQDGYEAIRRRFGASQVGVLHGRMRPEDKEHEMARFVRGETRIMVSTTVIEVGVNVPNATVMVIENAERFGLAQLHQLRGRVGRGADQSYCLLMRGENAGKDAEYRLQTMAETNDGFQIAEADLQLRGPGNLLGTQQSGLARFKIADLAEDQEVLRRAREGAQYLIHRDPDLEAPEHQPVKEELGRFGRDKMDWKQIS